MAGTMATTGRSIEQALIVGPTSSKCGNCGKGANPRETTHDTVLGYFAQGFDPGPGCGVEWSLLTSDYMNFEGLFEATKKLRPDLRWIDPGGFDEGSAY